MSPRTVHQQSVIFESEYQKADKNSKNSPRSDGVENLLKRSDSLPGSVVRA
jgi:3-deoxy-D-manno-octulosonic acid (KDO) 8-phosphate synthase